MADTTVAKDIFGPEHEPETDWLDLNMGPQHPVRAGMVRPHVQVHPLGLRLVLRADGLWIEAYVSHG